MQYDPVSAMLLARKLVTIRIHIRTLSPCCLLIPSFMTNEVACQRLKQLVHAYCFA